MSLLVGTISDEGKPDIIFDSRAVAAKRTRLRK